jgi:AcrR family transcriptional regulator
MTSLDKPRSRRLEPSARRAEILDAAAAIFRRRDPSSVRFGEVADAAGVSRSLVYTYFGDRDGLVAAVYLHTLAEFDDQLSELLDAVPVDEARFRAIVGRYFSLVGDNAESWRLFAAAGALDAPAVREARRTRMQRIADTWGGGGEARLLARGIIGLLEASATEWVEHRECSVDDAIDLLTRLLWDGIARIPLPDPAA